MTEPENAWELELRLREAYCDGNDASMAHYIEEACDIIDKQAEQIKAKDELLQAALPYVKAIEFFALSKSPWARLGVTRCQNCTLGTRIEQSLKGGDYNG